MSRLEQRFAELKAEGRSALVTFVTAGDPGYDASLQSLKGLLLGGLPGVHAMWSGADWSWHKAVRRNDAISTEAHLKAIIEHEIGHIPGMKNVCQSLNVRGDGRRPGALPVCGDARGKLLHRFRGRLSAAFVQGDQQLRNRNPILIPQPHGRDVPGAAFRVALKLKRQLDGGFGDGPVSGLANHAADRNGVGNESGRTHVRNLFPDFIMGESRPAAARTNEQKYDEKQLESPMHQGFESSML